jgi:RNA polymerase sigma-70 factor (ECF subfamily)
MTSEDENTDRLLEQAQAGDEAAMAELFDRYRKRLRQMVRLRLDRRLQGRVDSSDVLQDAYLDARQKLPTYTAKGDLPFFLWLRLVVGQKLTDLHRHHLGTKKRDAARDVSIYRGPMPEATSFALAAQLMGKITTPSHAAIRAESKLQIQDALNAMDAIDREVLTLRHFEMLTNAETAQVLRLSQAAASNRYVRALKRMKQILEDARSERD